MSRDRHRQHLEIRDLRDASTTDRRALAAMLVEAFAEHWPDAWPTIDDAMEEVEAARTPERLGLVASQDGVPVGWVGAIPTYEGYVWEVHPMVVAAEARGRGTGRALIEAVERGAEARGGRTLWVGTDDEDAMTTLGGRDLYPDPLEHLASIRDLKGHPFGFYRRIGFALAGVLPDANGPGKPDIFLAKRIGAG